MWGSLQRSCGPASKRALQTCFVSARCYSGKRLIPDPNKVPRSEPIDLRGEAFKKTNTIEDYSIYDVTAPPNNIESVISDGFKLNNGGRVVSTPEQPRALLLLGHEAYEIDLSNAVTGSESHILELDTEKVLGALEIVHPKPELLVIGLGKKSRILGPKTQQYIRSLGIQMEVGSTLHGASHFDLLAAERGKAVAGLLLPPHL